MDLEKIKSLSADEAIPILDDYIKKNPFSEEALVIRGMKYWSKGSRREAINDYLAAIKINPESRANMLLQYANSILDYYNKDLLNP